MQPTAIARANAGDEPIAGYRLIEPLGSGGFGEVWKCHSPSGVSQAIKIVPPGADGSNPASLEREALEKIKGLRHPHILNIETIEWREGTLYVVMELADRSLYSLFREFRERGEIGLPRAQLLEYLRQTADALDWMNTQHRLQHLDIKPHNLFLVEDQIKVADFGLVHAIGPESEEQGPSRRGGATPLYSAPEMLRGTLSRHSDQYSLAVVYQQLLTSTVPFWHDEVYELMMLHLTADPDLTALPPKDRAIVGRGLSKIPEHRYGSCAEFIEALASAKNIVTVSIGQRSVLETKETPAPSADWFETVGLTRRVHPDSEGMTQASGTIPGGIPTAITLPGYRFVSCLNQTPLGDIWRAEDRERRPCRALCLLNFVRYDTRLIEHLRTLGDPLLPPTEIHWSPAERMIILNDWYEGTLRNMFDECVTAGQPGIPRGELIELLRTAAEALDVLYTRHGLQHLGLRPRSLLVDGARLWLVDVGLIPLVWLPTGQPIAQINGRYCAPELLAKRASRSADQYSLALIYAEMLTGVHPRMNRADPTRTSGPHPRSMFAKTTKLDLDLLPAYDRPAVKRALSEDPEQRFASCVEFIDALAVAADVHDEVDCYGTLPLVVPHRSLAGEEQPPDMPLPAVGAIVQSLFKAHHPGFSQEQRQIAGAGKAKFRIVSDGVWECGFPFPHFPGATSLRIEGFRAAWNGMITEQQGEVYKLLIDVPAPRSLWERILQSPKRIGVEIRVELPAKPGARIAEALVRLEYVHTDAEQKERVLTTMAPQLFESLRTYMQVTPEQRARERLPLAQPILIYPVLPDIELAETQVGTTKNISFGGLSLKTNHRPPTDWLYVHLHTTPQCAEHALLVKVVRVQDIDDGVELGVMFPQSGQPLE